MKGKHSLHLDRIVRFRPEYEPPVPATPPNQPNQQLQDLIVQPLVFAFPDGADAVLG